MLNTAMMIITYVVLIYFDSFERIMMCFVLNIWMIKKIGNQYKLNNIQFLASDFRINVLSSELESF